MTGRVPDVLSSLSRQRLGIGCIWLFLYGMERGMALWMRSKHGAECVIRGRETALDPYGYVS